MMKSLEYLAGAKSMLTPEEESIAHAIYVIVAPLIPEGGMLRIDNKENGHCTLSLGKDPFCDFNIRVENKKLIQIHEPENGEGFNLGTKKGLLCDDKDIADIIDILNKNESLILEIAQRHIRLAGATGLSESEVEQLG